MDQSEHSTGKPIPPYVIVRDRLKGSNYTPVQRLVGLMIAFRMPVEDKIKGDKQYKRGRWAMSREEIQADTGLGSTAVTKATFALTEPRSAGIDADPIFSRKAWGKPLSGTKRIWEYELLTDPVAFVVARDRKRQETNELLERYVGAITLTGKTLDVELPDELLPVAERYENGRKDLMQRQAAGRIETLEYYERQEDLKNACADDVYQYLRDQGRYVNPELKGRTRGVHNHMQGRKRGQTGRKRSTGTSQTTKSA